MRIDSCSRNESKRASTEMDENPLQQRSPVVMVGKSCTIMTGVLEQKRQRTCSIQSKIIESISAVQDQLDTDVIESDVIVPAVSLKHQLVKNESDSTKDT